MGKNDSTMETRTQTRLDQQEEQLKELVGIISSLTGNVASVTLQLMEVKEGQDRLQGFVFQLLKRFEKQSMMEEDRIAYEHFEVSPAVTNHSAPFRPVHLNGYPPPGFHRTTPLGDTAVMAKKVKLPAFSGDDPWGWLTRAETYFSIHGTLEHHKTPLAHISMEGVAVHWFTIVRQFHPCLSWGQFKVELVNRFDSMGNFNPYEQLADLRQQGTVDDFEIITSMIPRESEALYLGYFISGLNEDIKHLVHLLKPETRLDAIAAARNMEMALGKKVPTSMGNRTRLEGEKGDGFHGYHYSSSRSNS